MYLGLLLPLSSVLLVLLDNGVREADNEEVEVDVSSVRSFEFDSDDDRAICPTKLGLLTILTDESFLATFSKPSCSDATLAQSILDLFCLDESFESGDMNGRSLRTSSINRLSHGLLAIQRSNQLQPNAPPLSSFGG